MTDELKQLLESLPQELRYDTSRSKISFEGQHYNQRDFRLHPFYLDIFEKSGIEDEKKFFAEFKKWFIANRSYNSAEENRLARELAKKAKEEEKTLKQEEKKAIQEEKEKQKELKYLEDLTPEEVKKVHDRGDLVFDEPFSGDLEWMNNLDYQVSAKVIDGIVGKVALKGYPQDIVENYLNYFLFCPRYGKSLWWNEYQRRVFIDEEPMAEIDMKNMRINIQKDIKLRNGGQVGDVYYSVAHMHKRNPVIEWFDSLKWDMQPRLETLLIDKLRAADTPLNRCMTLTWFIGAVKRIFQPGCKNEVMLILVGPQGNGKSTFFYKFFSQWGIENNININAKEQEWGMKLDQAWCVCIDELSRWDRTSAEQYKNWLSTQADEFRAPYDHATDTHKRHCVYCAATNNQYFLKDYSDYCERRYWPIYCYGTKEESFSMIDSLTPEYINQVWAEAYYLYKQNPDIIIDLVTPEMVLALEEAQRDFKTSNDDRLWESLANLLDKPYILQKDGYFRDLNDMLDQMMGKSRQPDPIEEYGYLNKVKACDIKEIMKNIFHDVRKHEYFKYNLKDWQVNVQDSQWNTKIYRRITPKEYYHDTEIEDAMGL